jgi:hypothetical protein
MQETGPQGQKLRSHGRNRVTLTKAERRFLVTLMTVAQKLLDAASASPGRDNGKERRRRSRAGVAQLRKQARAARKRKMPVKEIASKLGVTPAYIYQLIR